MDRLCRPLGSGNDTGKFKLLLKGGATLLESAKTNLKVVSRVAEMIK